MYTIEKQLPKNILNKLIPETNGVYPLKDMKIGNCFWVQGEGKRYGIMYQRVYMALKYFKKRNPTTAFKQIRGNKNGHTGFWVARVEKKK